MSPNQLREWARERAREVVGDNPPPLTERQQQVIRSAFASVPLELPDAAETDAA